VPARHDRCADRRHRAARRLGEGYRESTGSWADLLRDRKPRGTRVPVLAPAEQNKFLGFVHGVTSFFDDLSPGGHKDAPEYLGVVSDDLNDYYGADTQSFEYWDSSING
jgi:hypothetical protein